jgi:hypothetical protein
VVKSDRLRKQGVGQRLGLVTTPQGGPAPPKKSSAFAEDFVTCSWRAACKAKCYQLVFFSLKNESDNRSISRPLAINSLRCASPEAAARIIGLMQPCAAQYDVRGWHSEAVSEAGEGVAGLRVRVHNGLFVDRIKR